MSQPYRPNVLVKAYYAFKSFSFPWRRKFFRGFDLEGNSFYESYNPLTPNKLRRTVKYVKDGHYTDNHVTPQWMQWLRHTRPTAPTLDDLVQEANRIQATRQNALLISQKWEQEKARLSLVSPDTSSKTMADLDAKLQAPNEENQARQDVRQQVLTEAREKEEAVQSQVPKPINEDYMPAPGTKNEKGEWQPEPWNPASSKKPIRR